MDMPVPETMRERAMKLPMGDSVSCPDLDTTKSWRNALYANGFGARSRRQKDGGWTVWKMEVSERQRKNERVRQ